MMPTTTWAHRDANAPPLRLMMLSASATITICAPPVPREPSGFHLPWDERTPARSTPNARLPRRSRRNLSPALVSVTDLDDPANLDMLRETGIRFIPCRQ